jgi:hypothetical protein
VSNPSIGNTRQVRVPGFTQELLPVIAMVAAVGDILLVAVHGLPVVALAALAVVPAMYGLRAIVRRRRDRNPATVANPQQGGPSQFQINLLVKILVVSYDTEYVARRTWYTQLILATVPTIILAIKLASLR